MSNIEVYFSIRHPIFGVRYLINQFIQKGRCDKHSAFLIIAQVNSL